MNIVRIFNAKEVDEIILLDISASSAGTGPQFPLLAEIVSECFMPVAYGGGLSSLAQMERLLSLGVEKVALNSAALSNPEIVSHAAKAFGSQSVVGAMDVRFRRFRGFQVVNRTGKCVTALSPVQWAKRLEELGAGELLIQSYDRDGAMCGYEVPLIREISRSVSVPVIACGGAGSVQDLVTVLRSGGASAAAAGSLFVFHGKERGVLINTPLQGRNLDDLRASLLSPNPDPDKDFQLQRQH